MQNIVRYTKILMNISTKILLGLLGLLQIYEISYVFIHNYGSEYVEYYKGDQVYQYIFWQLELLYSVIFCVVIWKVWPQLSKLHKFYIRLCFWNFHIFYHLFWWEFALQSHWHILCQSLR